MSKNLLNYIVAKNIISSERILNSMIILPRSTKSLDFHQRRE